MNEPSNASMNKARAIFKVMDECSEGSITLSEEEYDMEGGCPCTTMIAQALDEAREEGRSAFAHRPIHRDGRTVCSKCGFILAGQDSCCRGEPGRLRLMESERAELVKLREENESRLRCMERLEGEAIKLREENEALKAERQNLWDRCRDLKKLRSQTHKNDRAQIAAWGFRWHQARNLSHSHAEAAVAHRNAMNAIESLHPIPGEEAK